VRSAYLDLEAASNQVRVAQQNIEVVQSQESVAGANLDYIDSVFAHNLAKLSLARALGNAASKLTQFLPVQQHP